MKQHEQISAEVCNYFSVTMEDMRSKSRKPNVRYPRQVLSYFLLTQTTMGCEAAARIINKHYKTILYSRDRIQERLRLYRDVRLDVDTLGSRINENVLVEWRSKRIHLHLT